MSNIIRILFFKEEEDLACYLTAFYNVHVDEELIKAAIAMDKYKWLNYLWIFKKNKLRTKTTGADGKKEITKSTIPFTDLFRLINECCRMDPENKKQEVEMRKVCEWLIPFE